MPLNTRHFGVAAMAAISSVLTATGYHDQSLPSILTYFQVNLIPAIITGADWISARWKEWKGVSGYSSFMIALQSAVNAAPELKAAIEKAGIKIPQ